MICTPRRRRRALTASGPPRLTWTNESILGTMPCCGMIAYVWLVPHVVPYRSNAAAHGMVTVIAPPAAPLRAAARDSARAAPWRQRVAAVLALARTSGPAPAPALVVAPAAFPAAPVGYRLCRGPCEPVPSCQAQRPLCPRPPRMRRSRRPRPRGNPRTRHPPKHPCRGAMPPE